MNSQQRIIAQNLIVAEQKNDEDAAIREQKLMFGQLDRNDVVFFLSIGAVG